MKFEILFLALMLMPSAFGMTFSVKNDDVLPFDASKISAFDFISDYATVTNVTVTFGEDVAKVLKRNNAGIITHQNISVHDLDYHVGDILESAALTRFYVDDDTISIVKNNENKDYVARAYTSDNFPLTTAMIMVVHKLNYSLGGNILKLIRADLSRMGRVYSTGANRIVVIRDEGVRIKKLLAVIRTMDTKKEYDKYLEAEYENAKNESFDKSNVEKLEKQIKEHQEKLEQLEKKMPTGKEA